MPDQPESVEELSEKTLMLRAFKRAWLGLKAAVGSFLQFKTITVPISKLREYADYLGCGTGKVWATFTAIDRIGDAVVDNTMTVRNRTSLKEVQIPELAKLLIAPNELQTFAELCKVTVAHVELTGNAFWLKDQSDLNGNRPLAIYALNPKRMKIVPAEKGFGIGAYKFTVNGSEITLPPWSVMHFKRPHPDNDYWGMGKIEGAVDLFQDHQNRAAWSEGFWKNGASPTGIMILEDQIDDPEEWKRIKEQWKKDYQGLDNSGKVAWLSGKWKYEQMGLTAQEMQNIESVKLNVEQIFCAHGVPLSIVGIKEAANYATARTDQKNFRQWTISPICKLLSDTISTDLVAGWGEELELVFNIKGLVDAASVMEEWGPAFDRGAVTINELREKLGLKTDPKNPLLESHYISAAYTPLELAGVPASGGASDQAARSLADQAQRRLLLSNGEAHDNLLAGERR